ncbi:hypothetical protein LSH36_292g01015 [Paralvinella palmiformis]|uniref:Intraflagellar transport protein 46 homolog n=1 Tax=Paralvinella palmiformis TaxID=53620 RepID=A0AAD9JJB2_9ANNE|nr:hypothetical protein LSH36_292g01015 [Paralvinella palmiformis]
MADDSDEERARGSKFYENQPYDEALEIGDAEDINSNQSSPVTNQPMASEDEPCAKQTDPTVLDLHLRSISKETNLKQVKVKSIENAEKDPKAIDNWIQSIGDLHRSKPPPNVHYTKNMPDIETLMQEWPPEFEELLKEHFQSLAADNNLDNALKNQGAGIDESDRLII